MPADDTEVFRLNSEEAAWDALRDLLGNRSKTRKIRFDLSGADWIRFRYTVNGDIFHQTITPSLMIGIVDFQRAFYRSAALILKDDADIRRLTDDEKDQLELVFRVGEGSSDYVAEAKEAVQKIASGAVKKMTGTQIAICVLVALLLYFGHPGVESYITGTIDVKKAEIQAGRDTAQMKALTDIVAKDSANLATLAQALRTSTSAQEIGQQSKDGYDSLVRHSGRAESVCVQGTTISRAALDELTQISRRSAKEVTITQSYIVKTIDRVDDNDFTIKLQDGNGTFTTATIDDAVRIDRFMRILQFSLTKTASITVTVTGRQIGDELTNAKITKASRRAT